MIEEDGFLRELVKPYGIDRGYPPSPRITSVAAYERAVGGRLLIVRHRLRKTPAEMAQVIGVDLAKYTAMEHGTQPLSAPAAIRLIQSTTTDGAWLLTGLTGLEAANDA